MARYLIRQANGLLALYSTVIDDLTDSDATEEEIIESFANEAAERERRAVRAWIDGKGEELRRRPLHATEALHRMAHWSPDRLAEARAVLTRPDLPEAVPAEPPEKAPAERALLGLLSDLQELFGTGPDGGCIFCPTTRPSHVVGHGKGCRVGDMLAHADGEGVVRDLVYVEEQRRTALVDLLGRLGSAGAFRGVDGGCFQCLKADYKAFFDYAAHDVACEVRHVLDGLPADVVAEATARFPWTGEDVEAEDEQP